jgi:F-type H+-transporting ATPase subunit b
VANFFKTRRQSIAETLNELQKRTELLEGKNRLLTDKLGELDKERQNILLQYQSDGEKERERIISEAQKTAKIIVERAEQTIEQEVKAAKRRLTVETGELSIKLARELLVKSVDEEDRNRLIHEFIGQVVKLPARN